MTTITITTTTTKKRTRKALAPLTHARNPARFPDVAPRMKAAVFVAVLIMASNCTSANANGADGPVEMRLAAAGAYALAQPDAQTAAVYRDAASFESAWTAQIGGPELPEIDFTREVAVLLLAGMKPTGGYSIKPVSAVQEGDVLVISAEVNGPPAGAIAAQVITSPWAVVAVTARDFKDVRWKR